MYNVAYISHNYTVQNSFKYRISVSVVYDTIKSPQKGLNYIGSPNVELSSFYCIYYQTFKF